MITQAQQDALVLGVIEEAILDGGITPSFAAISAETDINTHKVAQIMACLIATGRVEVVGEGQRRVYAVPGVEGMTRRVIEGDPVEDLEQRNAKFVAALHRYYDKHRAVHRQILGHAA
jgi:hypothetical protein